MSIVSGWPGGFGSLGAIGELPIVQLAVALAGLPVARSKDCLHACRGDRERRERRGLCLGCRPSLGLVASAMPLLDSSDALVARTNPSRAPRGIPVVFLDLVPPAFILAAGL